MDRRIQTNITIKAGNGLPITAPTEAWVSALILSLPAPVQARVMGLVAQYRQGALVGVGNAAAGANLVKGNGA